ncbi:16618_t:CDS:2, partial [Cetraspora pellucida]
ANTVIQITIPIPTLIVTATTIQTTIVTTSLFTTENPAFFQNQNIYITKEPYQKLVLELLQPKEESKYIIKEVNQEVKEPEKQLSFLEKEELRKAKEKLLTKLQELGQEVTEIIEREELTRVNIILLPTTTPSLQTIKVKVVTRNTFRRTISEEELACLIIYNHKLQNYLTYNLAVQQSGIAKTRIQEFLKNAKIIKPQIY